MIRFIAVAGFALTVATSAQAMSLAPMDFLAPIASGGRGRRRPRTMVLRG